MDKVTITLTTEQADYVASVLERAYGLLDDHECQLIGEALAEINEALGD